MSQFLAALIEMGVDPVVANIVDSQFQKVETNSQVLQGLQVQVAEIRDVVQGLSAGVEALQHQVAAVVARGGETAGQAAQATHAAHHLESELRELTGRVEGLSTGVQAAAAARGGAGSLPSGVKAPTPKLFDGSVEDPAALEAFLYSCELYFKLTGLSDTGQQAVMAILWLSGEAAVWWQTVRAAHEVGLTWARLQELLRVQFTPVDAARRARDVWRACAQGRGTVRAYVDSFRRALLHVRDAAPAEVLDRFIAGLAADVRRQVLVADPQDFERAALLAERVAGAGGEAPRGVGAGASSQHVPMELGAMYGPSPQRPRRGGASSGGQQQSGQRVCHYCKQPGHFMLSCQKLKRDMAAKEATRGAPRQSGRAWAMEEESQAAVPGQQQQQQAAASPHPPPPPARDTPAQGNGWGQ